MKSTSFYDLNKSILLPQPLDVASLLGPELALAVDHVVVESPLDDFPVGQVEFAFAALVVEVELA